MNCTNCGAPLQIEDPVCPHCGTKNEFAKKHLRDMQKYQSEFRETKKQVEEKVNGFSALTVKLTVIAVLIVLIVLTVYMLQEGGYSIWRRAVDRDINKNRVAYEEQLRTYIEEDEWIAVTEYVENKNLGRDAAFREYNMVNDMCISYRNIYWNVADCYLRKRSSYSTPEHVALSLGNAVRRLYEVGYRGQDFQGEYYNAQYAPDKQAAMERIMYDAELLLKTYFGLTDEELHSMLDLSDAKMQEVIEKAIERKWAEDE